MPKKPAKCAVKRTLWASLDSYGRDITMVDIWQTKPAILDGRFVDDVVGEDTLAAWMEKVAFRKVFGFAPKPGQCIEFENTARVVK